MAITKTDGPKSLPNRLFGGVFEELNHKERKGRKADKDMNKPKSIPNLAGPKMIIPECLEVSPLCEPCDLCG